MRPDFTIYEFLRRQLPNHKRQPNRLALFNWTLSEVKTLWDSFVTWREDMIYQSNITGQTLSLVHLLNKKVTGANGGISIRDTAEIGIYIGTLAEAMSEVLMSTLSEGTNSMSIELAGEVGTALSVNFQVVVPGTVSMDEVDEIVNRYVIAGMDYSIVT